MIKLLTVFGICLILAGLSSITSKKDLITGEYVKKERFFYFIVIVIMVIFVGLRTNFNDTYVYLQSYEGTPTTKPDLSQIDWSPGSNPGYNLLKWIFRYLGVSSQSYLMIYAAITVSIYLWFLRKYTTDITMSVFLLYTMGSYTFAMAAIKQSIAIAFCLVAVDRCIRKKWLPFVIWILIATAFHAYSLMYLICPFLLFRPWTKKTYWMLLIFGIIGFSLQPLLGTVIDITTMLGDEYTADDFAGGGINPFRFAVCTVPLLLAFVSRKIIFEQEESEADNLIMNLSALNAEIMFVGLFGTAVYFGRLANYFLIFQTISMPWLFKMFSKKSKTVLTLFAVAGYMMYFYYENAMVYGAFDNRYQSFPLFEYFQSIF